MLHLIFILHAQYDLLNQHVRQLLPLKTPYCSELLINPSNSLSGNNLSHSPGSMKVVSCSTSLMVVSISLEATSIISIASASVVDEDSIAFDLSFKSSFYILTFSLTFLYFCL